MTASRGRWRAGAAGIGIAALVAHASAARADDASAVTSPRGDVSRLDLAPSPRDLRPDPVSSGIDFTPTGATEPSGKAAKPPTAGEVSPLDLSPSAANPPAELATAPLPPEIPPPATNPEPPMAAAPPGEAATVPAPRAITVAPPPSAAEPVEPAASSTVATFEATPEMKLAGALGTALAGFVADAARARTQLDARPTREAIQAFYTARVDAPLWTDPHGVTRRGRELIARLRRADEDGLNISAARLPQDNVANATPAAIAAVETELSAAAVSYALQASGARVVPWTISPLVTAHPAVVDPDKALDALARADDPGEALAAFNPPQRGYRELREELARIREDTPAAAWRPGAGPVLRLGMSDPRVELIRARFGLGALSDIKAAQVYDARVASAVAAFQRVHGLAPDGALTPATSAAIFGPTSSPREAMILANMEMWRWEPRDMGQTRVEINVPDYTLRVLDGEDEIHRARVIVGKPDTPTPIFSNEIKYILFNPIWRVPDSIIKKEMAPKLAGDPGYLTRHGFKVTKVGDRLVVEQPPGEGNALGHILFMFPNEHAVYLHDTPARGLFSTSRRAYSHGCVRVEGPARLAELFMGGAARGWTENRALSLVGANEKTVFLPHPVPIHIEYFTEFVDETGLPQEREDVYGITAKVAATLSRFRQY